VTYILLQLKCTWSSISPKLWFRCRRIVVLGLPASYLPCNTNTNGEYGGWWSSSKPAFWMAASAWADMWSGTFVLAPIDFCFFLNWKNSWKDTKFLTTRTLSAWQMAGWKTKNNNSSTTEWELWKYPGPSAFQLQENMSKSDKIWCAYLVVNCVGLRTFWMPVVHEYFHSTDRTLHSVEYIHRDFHDLIHVKSLQRQVTQ